MTLIVVNTKEAATFGTFASPDRYRDFLIKHNYFEHMNSVPVDHIGILYNEASKTAVTLDWDELNTLAGVDENHGFPKHEI